MRAIVGAALAAAAMLIIGFIFHATPLAGLGAGNVDNGQAAALQSAMAANLPHGGTYQVPDPNTAEQTVMYGQGPIATIHYSARGYAAGDPLRYAYALFLNFLVALLIGAALVGLDRTSEDFGRRARLGALFGVAASAFIHLSRPLYFHHDWGNALYAFVADGLALGAAGVILAWFTPRLHSAAAPVREPM